MDAPLSDDLRIRTIRDTLDAPPPASRTHMPASEWYVQRRRPRVPLRKRILRSTRCAPTLERCSVTLATI